MLKHSLTAAVLVVFMLAPHYARADNQNRTMHPQD
jgi:hypothetical protein